MAVPLKLESSRPVITTIASLSELTLAPNALNVLLRQLHIHFISIEEGGYVYG
mgnify:CR=1 FL=1